MKNWTQDVVVGVFLIVVGVFSFPVGVGGRGRGFLDTPSLNFLRVELSYLAIKTSARWHNF